MSSAVQVTDNTPLLFKALAWDNYYRTQFPDSPDERPEFNSIIYDESSAEFKALIFDGGGVCLENVMDNKYSELRADYHNNNPVEPDSGVVPTRHDNDNTPLIFKALAWDLYYRTQFLDSPDERPEFNSMSYDESSAEFKALLFAAVHAHRKQLRERNASNRSFNDEFIVVT